jgi:hypothetical protein
LVHKTGSFKKHTAIDIDALPTCIYPGAMDLSWMAAEHSTDGSITMYQLASTEGGEKTQSELFAVSGVQENAAPLKFIQWLLPG